MTIASIPATPALDPSTKASSKKSHGSHIDFNRITDEQFQIAADHMKLESEIQSILRFPYRELVVQIPVRMSNGELEMFHGYRVHHNAVRGPYKGGIR